MQKPFSTKDMSTLEFFRFASMKRTIVRRVKEILTELDLPHPAMDMLALPYDELEALFDDARLIYRSNDNLMAKLFVDKLNSLEHGTWV